jgi:enamine deaminase RidA (YjgF/YER057c/UK114 family)
MDRQEYKSNAPWEDKLGYCRAVKVGQIIEVAGTTSVNESGKTVGDNYFDQTNFILNKIEKALQNFKTDRNSIIRTRIYVLDIEKWEEVAKAHNAFFSKHKPVCTLVEISQLIQKDLLIEIEVSAILN